MFIHFGLYSLGESHEWHFCRKLLLSMKKYKKKFLTKFNPDPKGIEQWVKTAKKMGAKYLVCTSKHHDGFCLWDTKVPHPTQPDYHIRNTPFWKNNKKDVLEYLFEAGKKHGIKIGLYYSTIDWSWSKRKLFRRPNFIPKNSERLKQYNHYYLSQLHELQERFPENLLFWFDGYQFKSDYPEKIRQKEVYQELTEEYPGLIVASNTGKTTWSSDLGPTDVLLLENPNHQRKIARTPEKSADSSQKIVAELCLTLNRHWGYNKKDKDYKEAKFLAKTVRKNDQAHTNTLLNFGPHWNGYILDEQVKIAEEIGRMLNT